MNKLAFIVKKLIKEEGNQDAERLGLSVCEKYVEYQKKPFSEVLKSIQEVLETDSFVTDTNSTTASTHSTTMSLNRALTSSYQKNGLSLNSLKPNSDSIESSTTMDTTTAEIKPSVKKRKASKVEESSTLADEITIDLKYFLPRPTARLTQLAGLDSTIAQIREMLFYPVTYASLYTHMKVLPPAGLLLLGPSGVGKTALAYAIAGDLGLPFFKVTGPELVGGTSGESEQNIRLLFSSAAKNSPSVLFIDSLDAIAGIKESSQRGMDRRIIAQFFDCMDGLISAEESSTTTIDESLSTEDGLKSTSPLDKHVIVIAATNRADSLDPGLRGRFSREINLTVPDKEARTQILSLVSKGMKLSSDVNFSTLGQITAGYVGSDLKSLTKEAGTVAVSRVVSRYKDSKIWDGMEVDQHELPTSISESLVLEMMSTSTATPATISLQEIAQVVAADELQVTMSDFCEAAKKIQPTAKREGFAVVPDVTWDDVGALAEVRDELLHNFLKPIANPARFRRLGLEVPAGVLFFGPPGCGKTLLAKALANQSGANFISVKGPELLNMYVGESESKVRQVFARARASTPCMIFFDELDALCPRRGATEGGSGVSERVVNQFLTELDGLEVRRDVYVVAATNRLELIDEAMLRPGRLGKLLYVPLPQADERVLILKALTRNVAIDRSETGVDLENIGNSKLTEGFSGADLAHLIREAGMAVVREWSDDENSASTNESSCISSRHFVEAFSRVRPSVSAHDRLRYEKVNRLIKEGLGVIEALRTAT